MCRSCPVCAFLRWSAFRRTPSSTRSLCPDLATRDRLLDHELAKALANQRLLQGLDVLDLFQRDPIAGGTTIAAPQSAIRRLQAIPEKAKAFRPHFAFYPKDEVRKMKAKSRNAKFCKKLRLRNRRTNLYGRYLRIPLIGLVKAMTCRRYFGLCASFFGRGSRRSV